MAELPARPSAGGNARPGSSLGPRLGVSVDQLTPQIARQLGFPAQTVGVVVVDVDPASPAEEAGWRRGDVIQEVNRNPVTSLAQFRSAITQAGNAPVLLLIDRGGDHVFVAVQPR